jgi:hypothetical protein
VLVIISSAAPLAALLLISRYLIRLRRTDAVSAEERDAPRPGAEARPWAVLAAEMARREHRPRRHSDEAVRERHLAAVLPAERRR